MLGADQETRARPAARVSYRDPVGRVEQLVERDAVDGVHLARVDDADRASPRATSRAPASPRSCSAGSHSSGSSAKTSTPSARRPVSSSASRRAASRGVSPGSIEPPGNDTWPGVGPHVVGPLGQQQVALRAEEQQYGAAPRLGVLGRDEAGQVVGRHVLGSPDHGLQPVGDQPPTPRYFRAAEATSACWSNTAGLDVGDRARRRRGRRSSGVRRCGAAGSPGRARPSGRRPAGRRPGCAWPARARHRAACRGSRRRAP